MNIAIIIPARYASTRFPGKPLAKINGKEMLLYTYEAAKRAGEESNAEILVATEDQRIVDFCTHQSIPCILTSDDCKTGSDRVFEAAKALRTKPDFILNLQGDAPFTPPRFLKALIDNYTANPDTDIVTPVAQLGWDVLDQYRIDKKATPFSGTQAVFNKDTRYAYWFSKTVIPAIRKEQVRRTEMPTSPVYRHIGLYGYSYKALETFINLPESTYEKLEGLEQLRALENGLNIRCVEVEYGDSDLASSGIDTPEDLARAEALLDK